MRRECAHTSSKDELSVSSTQADRICTAATTATQFTHPTCNPNSQHSAFHTGSPESKPGSATRYPPYSHCLRAQPIPSTSSPVHTNSVTTDLRLVVVFLSRTSQFWSITVVTMACLYLQCPPKYSKSNSNSFTSNFVQILFVATNKARCSSSVPVTRLGPLTLVCGDVSWASTRVMEFRRFHSAVVENSSLLWCDIASIIICFPT